MHRYTTSLVLLVAGLISLPFTVVSGLPGLSGLAKRQTSSFPDVPTQCSTQCDPVDTIITANGCTPSTCCISSFEMNYFNCFECLFKIANLTDFSQPQAFLNMLVDDCSQEGTTLPRLTFPGQNSTQASASASGTVISASSISNPPSAISQSTVTSVPPTSTSVFVQSTVSNLPTSTSASTTPSATTSSKGFRTADSTLGLGLSTIMLTACFYFAL